MNEMPGTVWCEPFIDDPDQARFEFRQDQAAAELLKLAEV